MSFAFMRLYTGDYLRDTRHLTPAKHGVYILLLMHCWDQKGPVPLDEQEAAGIANCRSADEIDSLRYVLNRYFVRMNDGWYNKRMAAEITAAEHYSHASSEGGKRSGEARRALSAIRKASRESHIEGTLKDPSRVVEGASVSPASEERISLGTKEDKRVSTIDRPKTGRSSAREYPPGFSEFWTAYPRKQAKDKAYAAWKAIRPDRAVLDVMKAAIARQRTSPDWTKDAGQFIPHPATWLRGGRWKDEDAAASAPSVAAAFLRGTKVAT